MFGYAVLIQMLLVVGIFVTTGLIGSTRRLGFVATLLISIVLTPIGGFVLALLSGPRRREVSKESS